MFTSQHKQVGSWWYGNTVEVPPVGRLAGQFSFQVMPNSTKLIVTTKNQSNYEVIDELVAELDKPGKAGLPMVVELCHANAEDLAEQLNALLAEPGTLAQILRSQRARSSADRKGRLDQEDPRRPGDDRRNETDPGMMPFWWQRHNPSTSNRPASKMIGKIRFVPVMRRNALMVLAPQAHMEPLRELIEKLDRPTLQVVIHAIIAEIQHEDVTTLGLRIAADPSLLNDPRLLDTAVGGSASIGYNDLFGGTFALGSETFGRSVLRSSVSVSALLQMLLKNFRMRVLFEPKIYTADNQESEFFDGQDVPVQTSAQTSAEGTAVTRSFKYTEVGTRLRVRPHITQEGLLDLKINLELSRIVPGESTFGNFTFDRRETTTHVVVRGGQTIMLSGIVRQEDFEEVRKVPLLGDIPLLGKLFRSVDTAQRNREIVAFITPRIIERPADADEAMQEYRRTLDEVQAHPPERPEGAATRPGGEE